MLTNFLRTLRFSYKQLAESLANLLRMLQILKNAFTNVKNACECLKNETNTKRVLADFDTELICIYIHRVKLFYFVFVWKRQLSLACTSDEKRDNGKPDRCPSHKIISSFKYLQTKCNFCQVFFFYFKRFLFATVYINQLHNFRSLNSTQNFKLTKKTVLHKGEMSKRCLQIITNVLRSLQMHCHQ